MAAISKYRTSSGATLYRVRYYTPDRGETQKRGFKTKRDAELFAATIEVSKAKGEYVTPRLGRMTVGELSLNWLGRKQHSTAPSHYRMLESAWRIHVASRWASVSVSDIDQLAVESWISAMTRGGAGATTVLRAHGVLSGILADAVKAKRLASNPATGIDGLPRKTARRHVYLSSEDVSRLADESGELRSLVLTLAYCGLRWGEAVALRVRDIEFLRRRIRVCDNAVQLGVDHAVGTTKGKESRSVPVPNFVLDELSKQVEGRGADDLVFGDGVHYLPRPKSRGGWFQGAVNRAGVQKITPHDLRHTCASLAVSAGANVLALARMLGHKDASVTLRVYSDLFDTDLDALADVMDTAYASNAARTRPRRCPGRAVIAPRKASHLHIHVRGCGGGGGI